MQLVTNKSAISPQHTGFLRIYTSLFIAFFSFRKGAPSLVVLSLLIFHYLPLAAQEPEESSVQFDWRMAYKAPSGTTLLKFFGWNNTSFFACRQKEGYALENRQKIYLEKYTIEGKLVRTKETTLKYKGKDRKLEDIIRINNRIYLFSSYHNLKDRKNYLFVQEINSTSLLLSKEMTKVSEAKTSSAYKEGDFNFQFSRDSQFLLVYAQHPLRKKDQEQFTLTILDSTLSTVWEKQIALPYPNKNFSVEECRIDNKGDVYVLGVAFEDLSVNRRQGTPDYKYKLLHFSNNGTTVQDYEISLNDLFITDLTIRENKGNELVCAGFYSEKNSYSIKGVCYFRIDLRQKAFTRVNTRPFDFDFITLYLSPGKKRKALESEQEGNTRKQAELYNYNLNDIILRNDGGAVLVAEQYFVERVETWDYAGRRYIDYYYHYNDIILANIRPDGTIQWTARVPKEQVTRNDNGYFSSYSMTIARNRLLFLFNDLGGGGNRYSQLRFSTRNPRNANLMLAEVQLDGTVRSFLLENGRTNPVIPVPTICRQINRESMILYGENGRESRIGILRF